MKYRSRSFQFKKNAYFVEEIMNKTLLSILAAAAGLIASRAALADAANVEIYGTLNTDFENVKASSARNAVPLPVSRVDYRRRAVTG